MLSELQKRKLTRKFNLLDFDANGVLERADFERVVAELSSARGLPMGSSRHHQLVERNLNLWQALSRFCDTNKDGRVSLSEWLNFHAEAIRYEQELLETIPGYESTLDAMASFIFELLDSDGDGKVTRSDYEEFCRAYRIDEADIGPSFERLDRNGDGTLSRQEVLQLVIEFYCSNHPESPGNWFFGSIN